MFGSGFLAVPALLLLMSLGSRAEAQLPPEHALKQPQLGLQWLTLRTGLPQTSVTAIAQTRDGYLWFGTFGGLLRSDGVRKTLFNVRSVPSLPSNRITSLHAATDGSLWVGTEDRGVLRYDGERFEPVPIESPGSIWKLAEGPAHDLWIGHRRLTHWAKGAIDREDLVFLTEAEEFIAFHPLSDKDAWVGTFGSIYRLRDGGLQKVDERICTAFLATDDGLIWSFGDGVVPLDSETNRRVGEPIALDCGQITAMTRDADGRIWIGSENGLWLAPPGFPRREQCGRPLALRPILTGSEYGRCRSLLLDREGCVWAGFNRAGACCIRSRDDVWTLDLKTGIHCLAEREDGLLFSAGSNALYGWRPSGEISQRIDHVAIIGDIFVDSRGSTWILRVSGLSRQDPNQLTEIWPHTAFPPFQEANGEVWVGSHGSLLGYDGRRLQRHPLPIDPTKEVRNLCIDSRGDFWFSLPPHTAVHRWDEHELKRFPLEPHGVNAPIRHITSEADGTLWVTTYGSGLVRLRDGVISAIDSSQGLPDDSLGHIFLEKDSLWLNSNRGVFALRRNELEALLDGRSNEAMSGWLLGTPEGNGPAGFRSKSGRLVFPTVSGIVGVEPVIRSSSLPPPVLIEEVIANGRTFAGDSPISAEPGSGSLQIHYTAFSFLDPEKLGFRYRLIGENDEWVDAGTRRTAFFTHLAPGDYEFVVEARTSEGVRSQTAATIRIHLPPLFHETLWFRALMALFGLSLVFGFHRLRLSTIRARNRALNAEIAARKESEEALRVSEAQHRALIETARDAIIIVGPDRRIVFVNAAAIQVFGLEGQKVDSLPISSLLLERSTGSSGSLDQLFQKEGPIGLQLQGHRATGGLFPVEVSSGRMERMDGSFAYALIVRDVTERQRLERQVAESSKLEAVGRLTGGIAHDFNNILTALIGHASMLEEDLQGEAAAEILFEHTAQIRNSTERAITLVQQLLTFARRRVVDPGVIDPNETIRQLEPMLRRLIPENILLELQLDASCGHVFVDAHELERVIVNLVVNAKDAVEDRGTILLSTGRAPTKGIDSGVTISVRDDGCGLSPDDLSRIFEPFYTTKPVGKGTGLGLASAYGFAEQAGGHIAVKSSPGEGTCFTITLPLVEGGSEAPPLDPAKASGEEQHEETRRLLLCDDEDMVRKTTAAVLRKAGYEVICAATPNEAIEIFSDQGELIDALVSDVVMPVMNGRQLAQRLLEQRPDLPVLFISGYVADPEWKQDQEPINLLYKPFSPGQLVERVRALFALPRP